jgi:dTDP-4-dehydrorhamnose 3,5-epimerase
VDIRKDSLSYGLWAGALLSEENKRQFWVPPGFAHGFVVLSDVADFEYKCTDYYDPTDEGCLMWNDPTVDIEWPEGIEPILSAKDQDGMALGELL